jgi:hypothetical protein
MSDASVVFSSKVVKVSESELNELPMGKPTELRDRLPNERVVLRAWILSSRETRETNGKLENLGTKNTVLTESIHQTLSGMAVSVNCRGSNVSVTPNSTDNRIHMSIYLGSEWFGNNRKQLESGDNSKDKTNTTGHGMFSEFIVPNGGTVVLDAGIGLVPDEGEERTLFFVTAKNED